jgi:manganese efflux pump family protein
VGFVVLITWFAAVLMGLFMLAVWLIENDVTDRGVAPSRLPVLVVFTHMFLAAAGLGMWATYLIVERMMFAWTAIGILGGIAALGATMFLRWIPVYRNTDAPTGTGQLSAEMTAAPAERNFPVAIVALHGLLAVSTLVLALLTAGGVFAPE